MTVDRLSLQEARAIAVAAQGLHEPLTEASALFRQVGCVQVDSIAVVRRSHELVALARGLPARETADLTTAGETFEYWAHAICLVPLQLWPAFAVRRRRFLRHGWRGPDVDPAACDTVRERLAAEGPLTLTELGGATGNGWQRSSPARWAAEWLQAIGEVVVTSRRGWRRVYALAATTLPDWAHHDLDDQEGMHLLVRTALTALGVATTDDVADYFRLAPTDVAQVLADLDIPQVGVHTWNERAWLSPDYQLPPEPGRVVPLSPFDSLIWHRPRQLRLFGRPWLLEAYKPPAKREFGYFAMPILAGSELAGRVAARRDRDRVLRVEAIEWVPERVSAGADALHEAITTLARWTDAATITYDHAAEPAGSRSVL